MKKTVFVKEKVRTEKIMSEGFEDDVRRTPPATTETETKVADIMKRTNKILEEINLLCDLILGQVSGIQGYTEPITLIQPSISELGELISEFSGAEDTFRKWQEQLKFVIVTYNLDNNAARILVAIKLKGRVLEWFHSQPEYLKLPVDALIEKMRNIFDNQLAEERYIQFEKRSWQRTESFWCYYSDKIRLAKHLPVDDKELVDHLINGIPNEQMREEARKYCFKSKEKLLDQFRHKMLPE